MVREMALAPVAALLIGGTALSAFAAIQQGQAAKAQAEFQSDASKRQAEISEQQADRERIVSRQSEEDFRRARSRDAATVRANRGVSGVESGSGAPLLASEDFAREVELQALRLRSGGETRATRLEQLASTQRSEASSFRTAGKFAQQAGFLRGGALLLQGGGATFAGK